MPRKVHADLAVSVHAELQHLRSRLGPNATISDAVKHALESSAAGVTLPISQTATPTQFFKDKDSRTLPDDIKSSSLNLAGLIDLATTLSGRTSEDLLREGLISACTRAVRDRFRLQAGESNAKGISDTKIALAVQELQSANLPIIAKAIQNRSGVRYPTILRWLENHPEIPLYSRFKKV